MDDYGGRPHWGKLHFQTAETLAPRYPEWDRFQMVRRRARPRRPFRQRLHPPRPRRLTLTPPTHVRRATHYRAFSRQYAISSTGRRRTGPRRRRRPGPTRRGGAASRCRARTGPTRTTAARRRPTPRLSGSGGHSRPASAVAAHHAPNRPAALPRRRPWAPPLAAAPRHPGQRLAQRPARPPGPGARRGRRWRRGGSPSTQHDLHPAVRVASPVADQLGEGHRRRRRRRWPAPSGSGSASARPCGGSAAGSNVARSSW